MREGEREKRKSYISIIIFVKIEKLRVNDKSV